MPVWFLHIAVYISRYDILLYFSSKEVQEESFKVAKNLPTYKNAVKEFEALNPANAVTEDDKIAVKLASAQIDMFQYGIPQPFGGHVNFNFYYYSKNGPERFMDILENKNKAFSTDKAIYDEMEKIEKIGRASCRERV